MLQRLLQLVCALSVSALAASYQFAAVWDGEKKISGACIVTQGDRIQRVGECSADGVDLSRFTAISGMIDADIAMRELIDKGLMGYGVQITSGGRSPSPNTADGVAEVLRVVFQQVGSGVDVVKMHGSRDRARM